MADYRDYLAMNKQIEEEDMNDYDHMALGVGNPMHPANAVEEIEELNEQELTELEWDNLPTFVQVYLTILERKTSKAIMALEDVRFTLRGQGNSVADTINYIILRLKS